MSSASFAYEVRDPLGKTHTGALEAASADEASQKLRRDGFQVLSVKAEDGAPLDLFPRRVGKKDIIHLTSQLAIMVETGITLSAALDGIASQEENPALKKLLLDLKSQVEQGENFSTALARHPRQFDRTYVSLIKASEQTGAMGAMLDRIAEYMQKEADMGAKVRASMAYPAVMATLAVGVTIFLLTYVLPKFAPLFKKKGMKLPTPTKIMMTASDALIDYWYLWLIGIVVAGVGYYIGSRTTQGRIFLDKAKISLPVLGGLNRKVILSRSLRTLGAMVAAGVSMLDALRLCAAVAGNIHYERLWEMVLDKVAGGERICDALHGAPLFPSTLIQMIGAGEDTGNLDKVLEKVSNHYDKDVELSLKTATSLIEPIMITVMGVVVGGIGMSLLLPIFSLSRG